MTCKREAALAWARRGFRVFPLWPNSKKPLRDGWTETATADAAEIEAVWSDPVTGWPRDFNIGVLTNELIVVDVDEKDGRGGMASFLDLDLPLDTLVARTPSGGLHVYFTGPNKSLSVDKLGPGLDIRSYHGYVIAPGSEIEGVEYTIENDAPMIPAPAHLIACLDEPRERQAPAPAAELDTPAALERGRQYLEQDAPLAIEGCLGDTTTFGVACALKDFGISEAKALDLMVEHWNDNCAPPWEPDELEVKVANAYEYGKRAPGSQSIEADFAGVDLGPIEPPAPRAPSPWIKHGSEWSGASWSWLFYEVIPAAGVGCLTGPSGAGKTFLLLNLGLCLASGQSWFGVDPDDVGGTLYLFSGSEGSGLEARLAALGEEDGPLPLWGKRISPLNVNGALAALCAEVERGMVEMQEQTGVPVRLVVLETLSASGLLADEKDNTEAARAIDHLHTLARRLGVTVIYSHHPPKEGDGQRGAGALRGNIDFVLEANRDGLADVRALSLTKSRNSAERSLGSYTLVPVTLKQLDAKGRPISSMVVSTSTVSRKKAESHRQWPLLQECIDIVLAGGEMVLTSGRTGASVDDVKDLFFERYEGSKNKSNMKSLWNGRLIPAVRELGFIDIVRDGGRDFFCFPDLGALNA